MVKNYKKNVIRKKWYSKHSPEMFYWL
jgi:hypothetical protein